jgi:hypothetical protein
VPIIERNTTCRPIGLRPTAHQPFFCTTTHTACTRHTPL